MSNCGVAKIQKAVVCTLGQCLDGFSGLFNPGSLDVSIVGNNGGQVKGRVRRDSSQDFRHGQFAGQIRPKRYEFHLFGLAHFRLKNR